MQVGALLVLAARLVGVALRARLHEQLLPLLGVTHLDTASARLYISSLFTVGVSDRMEWREESWACSSTFVFWQRVKVGAHLKIEG